MRASAKPCATCMPAPHAPGPWPNWRIRRRSRARHSTNALRARRGHASHGVPAGLAHGPGQGLLRDQGLAIAEVAERVGLRVGQHLQHRIQPARGAAARALCAGGVKRAVSHPCAQPAPAALHAGQGTPEVAGPAACRVSPVAPAAATGETGCRPAPQPHRAVVPRRTASRWPARAIVRWPDPCRGPAGCRSVAGRPQAA